MADQTRVYFQQELDRLETQALDGLRLVDEALGRTMEACEHQDIELAGIVIAADDQIDGRYLEIHQALLTLIATQAPVATDLRVVAALLHVIKHVERMGDQCVTICKMLPLLGHQPPSHEEIAQRIQGMGTQARSLVRQASQAFAERDIQLARNLVIQDDVIDEHNRACFQLCLDIADDRDMREWAMTQLLIARCLERVGDNAVDIGEQTAFVVTGLFREFEDASRGELLSQPHGESA
ncbi:MAG: phosphate signaling complex protein PhoU [Solirubrobacterales bacterium]